MSVCQRTARSGFGLSLGAGLVVGAGLGLAMGLGLGAELVGIQEARASAPLADRSTGAVTGAAGVLAGGGGRVAAACSHRYPWKPRRHTQMLGCLQVPPF